MYENSMVRNTIGLRDEFKRFFNHYTWLVSAILKPTTTPASAIRYPFCSYVLLPDVGIQSVN